MITFTQKRGDVGGKVTVVLRDKNGPVDLTGATVRFLAKRDFTDILKIDGSADVALDQSLAPGQVSYTFKPGDLDTDGSFYVEWEVSWGINKRTFPNNEYDLLVVKADLG